MVTCWFTDDALIKASGTVAHVTLAVRSLSSTIVGYVVITQLRTAALVGICVSLFANVSLDVVIDAASKSEKPALVRYPAEA